MTATRPRRGSNSGRSAASSAMFVSGPTGASSTGSSLRSRISASRSTACIGTTAALDSGQRRAAEPVGAVHDGGVAVAPHDQRPGGAGRDGDVLAPGQREHAQGVARRRLERQVARDRREGEQLDLRAREREQDRDRVVHAGSQSMTSGVATDRQSRTR